MAYLKAAYLTTPSHRLHYKTAGAPSQPPLLILHGFLGSCEDFSGVLPLLSEHFYCILPDLSGHGKTTTFSGGYCFAETARSLITLLNSLHIERSHLLGYSMGGRIALYLAITYPHRIAQTILESASPGLRTAQERQARIEKDDALAHQLETLPLPEFLTRWYSNSLFESLHQHPQVFAEMLQRRQRNHPKQLAQALRGLGTGQQPSLWESVYSISGSLMLMVGAKDHKFVDICHQMKTLCEKNKTHSIVLKEFHEYGHSIHLEAKTNGLNLYTETITSFLGPI